MVDSRACDVLVVGEVLVEFSTTEPLIPSAGFTMRFSGDALNMAAAAAAAGATVELVARVPQDELGDRIVDFVGSLGVGTRRIRRTAGQHGLYLNRADPSGEREFIYVRGGNAGSRLSPSDLGDAVAGANVVLASGVTCAISPSACATVATAARQAGRFVYDPNYRPRLTSRSDAALTLRRLAAEAEVVLPSWPLEATQLLGLADDSAPDQAADTVLALGAAAAVVTCGPAGALVAEGPNRTRVPAVRVKHQEVVDQTGAGDCLAGTLAARLALGDDLAAAASAGAAAAARSVRHEGGLGYLQVRR